MQRVGWNIQDATCRMQCVNGLLVRPAGWTSWTDQLDGPAGQTSWTDQFFLFEALASSHIQRFSFQFVHWCSFRVRRRPRFKKHPKLFCSKLSNQILLRGPSVFKTSCRLSSITSYNDSKVFLGTLFARYIPFALMITALIPNMTSSWYLHDTVLMLSLHLPNKIIVISGHLPVVQS